MSYFSKHRDEIIIALLMFNTVTMILDLYLGISRM